MSFLAISRAVVVTTVVGLIAAAPAGAVTARTAVAACPAATAAPAPGTVDQVERTVLCLVNLERSRRGLRALRSDERLARAAAGHSRDMVARDFFGHESPGGSTMARRIKGAGYLGGARFSSMGENIAWGSGSFGSPLRIMQSWMQSPGHRANILRRSFEEIGVGVALGAPGRSGDGATYTTDFGSRS